MRRCVGGSRIGAPLAPANRARSARFSARIGHSEKTKIKNTTRLAIETNISSESQGCIRPFFATK